MNCKDLDAVMSDLARDQMMDARLRETALAHAASCAICATRLEDARALTAGLRVAASAARAEAPARVEASLVAAFRAHHLESRRPAVGAIPASSRRWLYIAAGVAAAALIVTMISLTASRNQVLPPPIQQEAKQSPPAHPEGPSATPRLEQSIVSSSTPKHKRRLSVPKRAEKPNPGADDSDASSRAEIATDFFPLVNRESLRELDSGQLVRVELPRSALMSFGLPINMERANDRIKADVVVGQDGLARAIRFVR